MHKALIFILLISCGNLKAQIIYPDNETGMFEDMLTPVYYNTPSGEAFRQEVNKFIHFVRAVPFQHPLEDNNGNIPSFRVPENGKFGAPKGTNQIVQHHAATDYHVGNRLTNVDVFAAHSGLVRTYRAAAKYRDFLSIEMDVEDENGIFLGKLLSIYAHIDLDLDSLSGMNLDGQQIQKGELISKNLYSGTVGGPHLHFEIRYYRPSDIGNEEFYGIRGPNADPNWTMPGAGSWEYGFWDPNSGYGFGNPENHLNQTTSSTFGPSNEESIQVFPNPCNGEIQVLNSEGKTLNLYNNTGQLILRTTSKTTSLNLDLSHLANGIYYLKVDHDSRANKSIRIIKQ